MADGGGSRVSRASDIHGSRAPPADRPPSRCCQATWVTSLSRRPARCVDRSIGRMPPEDRVRPGPTSLSAAPGPFNDGLASAGLLTQRHQIVYNYLLFCRHNRCDSCSQQWRLPAGASCEKALRPIAGRCVAGSQCAARAPTNPSVRTGSDRIRTVEPIQSATVLTEEAP